jgi:hypothetical protein
MPHPILHTWPIWIGKANLIIWIINAAVFAVLAATSSGWTELLLSGYFSKITLLETGIAFLAAGAIAFSGSVLPSKAKEYSRKTNEQWSMDKLRKNEKKANKYIALAVILFLESLLVSFLGF